MGIINKLSNAISTPAADENQLAPEEIEFLLNALKTTTLMGEHVEMFYNMVVKLQNQYIEQTK
jgi:hypothetical protein